MWSGEQGLVGHFAFAFQAVELSAEGTILRGGFLCHFVLFVPGKSAGWTPLFLEIITVILPVAVSFFGILLFFLLYLLHLCLLTDEKGVVKTEKGGNTFLTVHPA